MKLVCCALGYDSTLLRKRIWTFRGIVVFQGTSNFVEGKHTFRRDFEIQLSLDTESRQHRATTSSTEPLRKSQISYFACRVRQLLRHFVATVKSQHIVTGALSFPPFSTKRLWKMEHLVKNKFKVNAEFVFL